MTVRIQHEHRSIETCLRWSCLESTFNHASSTQSFCAKEYDNFSEFLHPPPRRPLPCTFYHFRPIFGTQLLSSPPTPLPKNARTNINSERSLLLSATCKAVTVLHEAFEIHISNVGAHAISMPLGGTRVLSTTARLRNNRKPYSVNIRLAAAAHQHYCDRVGGCCHD